MVKFMVKVFDLNGNVVSEISLPKVFTTPYRPDVIKRAVLAMQSKKRQPYGTDPLAGKRSSAHYHGYRRYRFTMMNKEMSRIPRIHGKGARYYAYRARVAPQAVKGRRAHPPKAEKIWIQKLNSKEKLLAIKSALAATANIELLKLRGHSFESPVIFVDEFENLKKTKEIKIILKKIIPKELQRSEKKKVRPGKGKMRGRKYQKKKGPVIIFSKKCDAMKSAKSMPGIDVTDANNVNAELLAPGTQAGRLLITTKSALQCLEKKFGE